MHDSFISIVYLLQVLRIIIILSGFVLLSSCARKGERVSPTVETITESVYASGIVKTRNQYEVFATVSALVREINAAEGRTVRKGDVVLRLVNENARLNLEQSMIAAEQASVKANRDKLRELDLNRVTARAKMEHDEKLAERQRSLWSQGIGSKNELDARELAATTSAHAYRAANARYDDFDRELRLQSQRSRKQVELSESQVDDFVVRSRMDGKVYKVYIEPGELVTPQKPVALIGDAEDFMLELQVDEYDIVKILPGQKVLLQLDSYKGQVFEAEVTKINPAMNQQSRSFTVEAAFTRSPDVLFPNLNCEANIVTQVKPQALTIPRNYLIEDSLVQLSSKELRPVRTGLKDYAKVEILEGLSKDDIILKPEDVQ